MKKFLFIPLFLLTLFVSMNKVNAETDYYIQYDIRFSNMSYPQLKSYIEQYSDVFSTSFENVYNMYKDTYDYYMISIFNSNSYDLYYRVYFTNTLPSNIDITTENSPNFDFAVDVYYSNSTISTSNINGSSGVQLYYQSNGISSCPTCTGYWYGANYFFSNFDLHFTNYNDGSIGFTSFNNQKQWMLIPSSANITTMYDLLNLTFLSEYDTDTYTEINLDNWPYIVLSLKSYSDLISPVVFDVQGQACITPVYNYGTQEKTSITDRCTLPYETFTPIRYYISDTDIQNNVVYYVSAYSQSGTNKIKVNTRVFDISYISQADANNPNIEINGRIYPIIPFGELTNTTNENETNNYIPGQTENIFDITSDSSFISELFSNPLEVLTTTWTSILTMFSLIGSFIGILPTTLQAFLMVSFSIGICLGIIKIVTGG